MSNTNNQELKFNYIYKNNFYTHLIEKIKQGEIK